MVRFGILIKMGTELYTLDPQKQKPKPSTAMGSSYKEADVPFGSDSLWCVCVCMYVGRSAHTWQLKNLMRLLLHTSSFSLYSNGDSAR